MKIDITSASKAQLQIFARTHLGLDIDDKMSPDAIRAKISTANYNQPTIEVGEPQEAPKAFVAGEPDTRKRVRIIIPNQDGSGGKDAVPVGVNGKVALIKRGVEVDLPYEYLHVLENAKKVQFDKGPNGEPINPQLVPTHSYSVIRQVA